MRAVVFRENEWEDVGQEIEVLGFIPQSGGTWAVYRLDDGLIRGIPTWAIRILPYVEPDHVDTTAFGGGYVKLKSGVSEEVA